MRLRYLPLIALLCLLAPPAHAQKKATKSTSKANGAITKEAQDQKPVEKKHKMTDTVGLVNDVPVLLYDYKGILSDIIRSAARDSIVSEADFTKYVDAAWDRVVENILVEQEIDKRHLRMTNEQVIEKLAAHPPEELANQFRDSAGVVHSEYIKPALMDPRNDSVSQLIVGMHRVDMEQASLMAALFTSVKDEADLKKQYEAWLSGVKRKARIMDKRTSFGYY